jgi:dihydropteroate synthase-like protein
MERTGRGGADTLRILLVTGRDAEESVRKYASDTDHECTVLPLPRVVAALLTPSFIVSQLRPDEWGAYDLILTPGLMAGDVTPIEEATGIPTFKGPRYAADLPTVLSSIRELQLSKTVPADTRHREAVWKNALRELETLAEHEPHTLREGSVLVGTLLVGSDVPVRVMAEIVDAPRLTDDEIVNTARHYLESGADIIDIGMESLAIRPETVARIVRLVKRVVDVPICLDTMDAGAAEAGAHAGVDMLLSVDAGNMREFAEFASDVVVGVLPSNQRLGVFPTSPVERIRALERNIQDAEALGMTRIVADPVLLSVPALTESLVTYREFARRNPTTPLLMGIGNVTELVDADSIGMNALLAGIAGEHGVGILLTTESSSKTRGSVRETVQAATMMRLAKARRSPPKDLGVDLLVLKEKVWREEPMAVQSLSDVSIFRARPTASFTSDSSGNFEITLDRSRQDIVALHYTRSGDRIDLALRGKSAEALYKAIVRQGLVSSYEHAAYLGYELGKAEVALITGKAYLQDEVLFQRDTWV